MAPKAAPRCHSPLTRALFLALAGMALPLLWACGDTAAPSKQSLTSISATDPNAASSTGNTNDTAATTPNQTETVLALDANVGMALQWQRDPNQCLAALGAVAQGTAVGHAPCDGSLAQQWTSSMGYFSLNNFCMSVSSTDASVVLAPCASNANQKVSYADGVFFYYTGSATTSFAPTTQGSGNTVLFSQAQASTSTAEPAGERVYLAMSTPNTRGFVIRPESDLSLCMALEQNVLLVAPCDPNATSQRWLLNQFTLQNIGAGTCVTHNGHTGPLTPFACASASESTDGFWLGSGGDIPERTPNSSGVYQVLLYDPSAAQSPNVVQWAPNSSAGKSWRVGNYGPLNAN